MYVHRLADRAVAYAPAKLNLFFEVLGKRSDGFHEIETLMVPIGLFDTLEASADPAGHITLDCRWASHQGEAALGILPPAAANLATRAVELLRQRAGVEHGLRMTLVKWIPSAAGLGGGSSDAAAALLAANAAWNLGWSRARLAELAGQLGSDVPFFLGTSDAQPVTAAICRGRGEQIESRPGLGPLHFVVIRPPVGLSTAEVYAQVKVPERPRSLSALVEALAAGDRRRLSNLIHNRLQEAAARLTPWIGKLERLLADEDCLAAQMSGSGSSYFGICRHALHARRVARRLQTRDIGQVYAVSSN